MTEALTGAAPAIQAVGSDGSFLAPLTREQARLWFLAQADPTGTSYHMAYRLRLTGRLDVAALGRAVDQVVARHEALRTRYVDLEGEPRQLVGPARPQRIERADLSALSGEEERARELRRLEMELVLHPFDLASGELMRLRLVRLYAGEHHLVMVMHHIIGDGWSHAVLVRDICAFYRAEISGLPTDRPAPLLLQYADYAQWQSERLGTPEHAGHVRFWIEQMAEVHEPLALPRDSLVPGPATQGDTVAFRLPADLRKPLAGMVAGRGRLLSAVLLACYEAALSRFAGQESFPLGIAIANRTRNELADLIGFFVNTLPLPADTAGSPTFYELVDRVVDRLLEAQERQEAPFDLIIAGLGASGRWGETPIIKALFVLQNAPRPDFDLAGVTVAVERIQTGTSKFELTLFATETAEELEFELEYDARLFARETIENFRDVYLDLLSAGLEQPNLAFDHLPLLARSRPSLCAGPRRPELASQSVVSLLLAQAHRTPGAIALEAGDGRLTYQELLTAAGVYAALLRQRGIGHGSIVAVLLPRRPELVVAILGILLAGAAYAPMNPELPAEYLRRMIAGARVDGVIAGSAHAPTGAALDAEPLPVPSLRPVTEEAWNDEALASPSDLAYLLHTSGSTGTPKGVLVEHAGLANICLWIVETLALGPGDRCLLKTPITFDAAAREFYPILLAGGTLVIAGPEAHRDIVLLQEELRAARATVLHCVPSQLEALLAQAPLPASVRAVMCGGEGLRTRTARHFQELGSARLWNVYGPTEATVDALAFAVEDAGCREVVPLGHPIPNLTVAIIELKGDGRPVPRGAVGEIQLRGIGVARGYRDSAPGGGAFTVDLETGEREYSTGDLGRIGAGGVVEFLGRRDRQVKRNGVRLEPAAIERAADEHSAVGAVHVAAVQADEGGAQRLLAFVAPAPSCACEDAGPAVEKAKVADWRTVFDASYESLPLEEDARENTHGWLDSLSREPISRTEVLAAAGSAADRILRWGPRKVLEIGCGTGLVLFRVAPHCERYDAVDFARQAVEYAGRQAQASGLAQVTITHGSALEFTPTPGTLYDAIVLNSVVQYLPGPDVLARLLDRLTPYLAPHGFFFVGDVRDARLVQTAAVQRALRRASPRSQCGTVAAAALFEFERDDELCLDPAFFCQWTPGEGRAGLFAPPLIEPKTAAGDNELVKYRFDATLVRTSEALPPVCGVARVLGRYRNRLIAGEVDLARSLAGMARTASVAELSAGEASGDGGPWLSPAEALAAIAPTDGTRLLCRADAEPDWFEVVAVAGDASLAEVARAVGHTGDEPSIVRTPGHFQRFLTATADLSDFLRSRLPSYEMPDRVIRLPFMPLSPHGKLDVGLLCSIEDTFQAAATATPALPKDPVESAVCSHFSAVVGVPFGVDDDFFLNGGHSLLATQARSRLARHFDVEIPLRLLFETPGVRSLAAEIRRLLAVGPPVREAIARRANPSVANISSAQARLWFVERLGTERTVYNMAHAMRMDGLLDLDALDQAVGDLLARHAPLRSRFPERDGFPTVIIDPPLARGNVEVLAAPPSGLEPETALALLRERATVPFDLERDRLVRVFLVRLASPGGEPAHLMAMVVHHIVADGWSVALALRELATFYNLRSGTVGPPPEPLAVDYYDFAAWQAAARSRGLFADDLRYWLDELSGAPPRLLLPYDHRPPTRRSWRGDQLVFEIPEDLTHKVKALSRGGHATDFITMITVFSVLLHKLSGMEDFVVGTVIANRQRQELEPLVGFLVNPLALRVQVEPGDTFAGLLERMRRKALAAFEHQEVPFELVLEGLEVDRRADYQAVFQTLFAMQNAGSAELQFHGLRCERVRLDAAGAMFDLSLEMREVGSVLRAVLEYSTDLWQPETAHLLANRYLHLLGLVACQPGVALADLSITSGEERERILALSRGARSGGGETMLRGLCQWAVEAPERTALEDGLLRLTYAELGAAVATAAGRLRAAGVVRGDRVGIHLPRGAGVAVASFAAQSLGAAAVYIDPSLPKRRRQKILTVARPRVCVTSSGTDLSGVEWLDLGAVADLAAGQGSPSDESRPGDAAFATFTSGSSGSPKAVVVSQEAIARRLRANDKVLGELGPDDRVAHAYSFNYDGGLVTLFWPLCSGATVVFLPVDILGDAERLAETLRRERITVFDAIPAVLGNLFGGGAGDPGGSLRLVVTGGDACPEDLPARVLAAADLVFADQYGPCEAVVNATTWTTDRRQGARRPTIGRPIPDADVFIVDSRDRLCPIGVPGEILIGGPALAEGYLDAPELTAEKFPWLDLAGDGPERLYRSGDQGRWTIDGEIQFLGRLDRQVQIRGRRSDPAEVEAVLRSCPGARDCRVVAEGTGDRLGFVAYVVPEPEGSSGEEMPGGERERIAEWRGMFDALYQPPPPSALPDADLTGWNDTATGEPIAVEDMVAWRRATLDRLLSRPHRRVLEIGAGLGLIALPLAAHAESYIATDLSEVAVCKLEEAARRLGLAHLSVLRFGAADLDRLAGETFDLIVLNSVAQYFPSAAFLGKTLAACGRLLARQGSIFVGDVRDARLARLFHLSVAAARYGGEADLDRIRRSAAESEWLDEELQVAPALFAQLPDGRSGSFSALPLLKTRAGGSEMARFRYDVWLRSEGEGGQTQAPEEVLSWRGGEPFYARLTEALQRDPERRIRLQDVLNRRLEPFAALASLPGWTTLEGPLSSRLANREAGIDPDELLDLAESAGRPVTVLAGGADDPARFDAVFLARGETGADLSWQPRTLGGKLFSNPLLGRFGARLRPVVTAHAMERLPDHMRPTRYVFVDQIPRTRDGKTDFAALADLGTPEPEVGLSASGEDLPLAAMEDVWRGLIGCEDLTPEADFFALGGHSLLAARLAGAIRREFQVSLPVIRIFELRTLRAITREVALLRSRAAASGSAADPPAIEWFGVPPERPGLSRNQRSILARLSDLPKAWHHVGLTIDLGKAVDPAVLSDSLSAVAGLHPMLARRFAPDGRLTAEEDVPRLRLAPAATASAAEIAREPLDLETEGPLSLTALAAQRGAATLVLRAHPAFFDSESFYILLRDLASAYRALAEGRDPQEGRSSTDYAALAAWEARQAMEKHREDEAPLRPHALPGMNGTRPLTALATWREAEVKLVQWAAAGIGVTPCATLLGCFTLAVRRFLGDVLIECPVSTRTALGAAGVIGPFAVDTPLQLDGVDGGLPEVALQAAREIGTLFEGVTLPAELPSGRAACAFSYQERAELDLPWLRGRARASLQATPFWVPLKLSVRHHGSLIELRLTRDPHQVDAAVADGILAVMRAALAEWETFA